MRARRAERRADAPAEVARAMMQYLDLSMLDSRAAMLFALVTVMTLWLLRHAGRRWFPPVFFIAATIGVASYTGVLRPDAAADLKGMATDKIDAAGARAEAIGSSAHATSAGSAGASNEAYERNVKNKKR
jgi:hypothetical protein